MWHPLRKVLLLACLMGVFPAAAKAQKAPTKITVTDAQQQAILDSVGWTQNLHDKLPLNLTFRDDQGKVVQLGDYFGAKPVVLTLMYLECPMLCGEVINGTFQGLENLKFQAGRDFQYVAVSINPNEGPKLAAEKKAEYLKRYGMQDKSKGFHFLTGEQSNIEALAQAVGFRYAYDSKTRSYAHPAGIILVTPDGHISRYMGGVVFHQQDLRLGLVDSSQGKVGSPADLLLLKCCTFDASTGRYNLAVQNMLRAGGTLVLLGLGILIFTLTRRRNEDG